MTDSEESIITTSRSETRPSDAETGYSIATSRIGNA